MSIPSAPAPPAAAPAPPAASPGAAGSGLASVVDQHLRWIGQWHRAVLFPREPGVFEAVPMPDAFPAWARDPARGGLGGQPAVDRLTVLHDQMHRLARLLLMKSAAGEPPTENEYEAVIGRFEKFMSLLRRVERAFGAAASGIDTLTGLRSRSDMLDDLEREMNRLRRAGQPFCLAICDVDKFKSVNDRFGHDIGDRVLAATAACVARGIRSFDDAYRMGGEEFLICLKQSGLNDGFMVIDRLRQDLGATPIPLPDGGTLHVTASFGLVQATPDTEIDALIIQADKALYLAKNAGRNRVVRFGVDNPPTETAPLAASA
jgi:diguanylate cyclase (GGDEF)-like protein